MPNSERPRNRLSSWQSWLGQYERFLKGFATGDSDADKIRLHVLESYIEPARERDDETVELIVKTVNDALGLNQARSEEHTSELQSLMRISYAVFCLKKKTETSKEDQARK